MYKMVDQNLVFSLYQILEVDERSQSLIVNVWMVQVDQKKRIDQSIWNRIGMTNSSTGTPKTTIILARRSFPIERFGYPIHISTIGKIIKKIFCNLNGFSEALEQKKTEALMNAIVSSSGMINTVNYSTNGASVQLMFPAIYKLSCKMNVRFFPYDQQVTVAFYR